MAPEENETSLQMAWEQELSPALTMAGMLFPPDTWEDSLHVSGTGDYIGISVPGSLASLSG